MVPTVPRRPDRAPRWTDPGHHASGRLGARARLAMLSPWPPLSSGVADYADRLGCALDDRFQVDRYRDATLIPSGAIAPQGPVYLDHRLLSSRDRALSYQAVIHQIGNSHYHGFCYEAALCHPGLVDLHDPLLGGLHFWRAHQGGEPFQNLTRLVEAEYPAQFRQLAPELRSWTEEPGGFAQAATRRGFGFQGRLLRAARAVVVHSQHALDRLQTEFPDCADRLFAIPLGCSPLADLGIPGHQIRARFGIAPQATVIGCFGLITRQKLWPELIDAFGVLAREVPGALLLFVGEDRETGAPLRLARERGLTDRVRFLGRRSESEYDQLRAITDVGVCLRAEPTYGESSAALLDLLGAGIPTVVSAVGSFREFPGSVVLQVASRTEPVPPLIEGLRRLLGEPALRRQLGAAARAHIEHNHAWSRVARQYETILDQCSGPQHAPSHSRIAALARGDR